MSLEKKAREFLDKHREFTAHYANVPLEPLFVDAMASFAAPYEAALRDAEEIVELLHEMFVNHEIRFERSELREKLTRYMQKKQALASASDLLEGGNDDQG